MTCVVFLRGGCGMSNEMQNMFLYYELDNGQIMLVDVQYIIKRNIRKTFEVLECGDLYIDSYYFDYFHSYLIFSCK